MNEKSTRGIPAEKILRSPIETLESRTRSGILQKNYPMLLRFEFQRPTRVEGFDFLDCDASVRAVRVRSGNYLLFRDELPLAEIDSRIYGPWKLAVVEPDGRFEIELDGEGRFGFILRTSELP